MRQQSSMLKIRFFIFLFLRFVFFVSPSFISWKDFFVPAKAGLTYELLQTIYHRPFKTQKPGTAQK